MSNLEDQVRDLEELSKKLLTALRDTHAVFDYGEYTAEEMNIFAEKRIRRTLEEFDG